MTKPSENIVIMQTQTDILYESGPSTQSQISNFGVKPMLNA